MTISDRGASGASKTPQWIDLGVLTVLAAIALAGFASSFADASYVLPGIGGLLVGTASILVARRYGFDLLTTAAVAIGAYFLLGTPFTMPSLGVVTILPSPQALAGLAIGAINGWADVVTLTTPVEAPYYMTVVPYAAAWLVAVLGAVAAVRWFPRHGRTARSSLVALTPSVALYVATVLLGTDVAVAPKPRALSFAAIALVWLAWRPATGDSASALARRALIIRKTQGALIVVVGALIAGGVVGAASAPTDSDRYVLRENVQPPFDPRDYPSPLDAFRHYTKELGTTALFSVTGLQPDERIRLATLDTYDGTVWSVTDPGLYPEASGAFRLVGSDFPSAPTGSAEDQRQITITLGAYNGVWLPTVGYTSSVLFADGSAVPSTALLYNGGTGIALVKSGVRAPMVYTLTAVEPTPPSDAELQRTAVATATMPPVSNVPDIVGIKAKEFGSGVSTPYDVLIAIQAKLLNDGRLSHGLDETSAPSSAGQGADRIKVLLGSPVMVGDGEQYATAFALMARGLGFPARVVMGFAPKVEAGRLSVDVTGLDVAAWVEVEFQGVGWVPFDVTPTSTEVPKTEVPQPQSQPQPQVRQPPRNVPPQEDLVSAVQTEDPKKKDITGFVMPAWVVVVAKIASVPLILYVIPVAVVALVKSRRKRRRRAVGPGHTRAAGAWDELLDTYAELGYIVSRRMTRVDMALNLEDQFRREVAARHGEREAARLRANEREEARAKSRASAQSEVQTPNPLGGFLDATVLRARHATAWRPGVADAGAPLPALPGLRDVAVDVDAAVFSGREIQQDVVDKIWESSDEGASAARASVTWVRRQLSRYRVRTRKDYVEAASKKFAAATSLRLKAVAGR
jgi:hypothetical protein